MSAESGSGQSVHCPTSYPPRSYFRGVRPSVHADTGRSWCSINAAASARPSRSCGAAACLHWILVDRSFRGKYSGESISCLLIAQVGALFALHSRLGNAAYFAGLSTEVVSPEQGAADVVRLHRRECGAVVEIGVAAAVVAARGLALHISEEAQLALARVLRREAGGKTETVADFAL